MYKKIIAVLSVCTVLSGVFSVSAAEVSSKVTEPLVNKNITALFEQKTRLKVISIHASGIDGLSEVVTDGGLFYVSNDAKHFISGKMFRNEATRIVDVSEERLGQMRLAGIAKFNDNMIEYTAKDEKYVVTIFTDITCGYCRKLHSKMSEYNDLGITVRYLAFPRSGVYAQNGELTQGFQDLRSIWCNENPAEALTKGKNGALVAKRICDAPIEEQLNFGRQIGVSGTPAIVLETGQLIPGFQEPEALLRTLVQSQS